jgi:hypothetical protein
LFYVNQPELFSAPVNQTPLRDSNMFIKKNLQNKKRPLTGRAGVLRLDLNLNTTGQIQLAQRIYRTAR